MHIVLGGRCHRQGCAERFGPQFEGGAVHP